MMVNIFRERVAQMTVTAKSSLQRDAHGEPCATYSRYQNGARYLKASAGTNAAGQCEASHAYLEVITRFQTNFLRLFVRTPMKINQSGLGSDRPNSCDIFFC